MIAISPIKASQTYPIRAAVLRPGYSLEECVLPGDDEPDALHFGAFDEARLLGIASVFAVSNTALAQGEGRQLRGMAAAADAQGRGIGSLLLAAIEQLLQQQDVDYLWANARERALGFYQKAGYDVVGERFDVPTVGPHFLVIKQL